jgi:Condensation domain/AMP-binding enzyme C-terminal domain
VTGDAQPRDTRAAGAGVTRRGPLSPAQRSLWLLEKLGGSGVYHNLLSVTLSGPVDRPALERALRAVAARHETLRTRFVEDGGVLQQEVLREPALALEDLSAQGGFPRPATVQEAASLAGQWASAPFALAAGPPVRASLTPAGAARYLLVIAAHHLVSDGDSMMIVLGELLALYEAQVSGGPDLLPGPPTQFLDLMSSAPGREAPEMSLAFWRDHLSGAPGVLDLPLDRLRPARPTYRGAVRRRVLQPSTVAAVRELARGQRVSVFMAVLAMLGVLLTRLAGTSEVVVGIPVSSRRDAQSRATVGYLVNTIAVRLPVRKNQTAQELLTEVRRIMLRAYDRSQVPFDAVVRDLRPPRRPDHHPVFQVLLAFTDRGDGASAHFANRIAGLELAFSEVEPGTARTDISFCVHGVAGTLAVDVEHAADLCDPDTAAGLGTALESLLLAAARDPAQPVSTLPLGQLSERIRPRAGHGSRPRVPRQQTGGHDPLGALLTRASAVARQSPDRVVLSCPDCDMTAASLHRATDAAAGGTAAWPAREVRLGGMPGAAGIPGLTGCRRAAAALRALRAAGPLAGSGDPIAGPAPVSQTAVAYGGMGDRESLAAAVSWLLQPSSPLRSAPRVVLAGAAQSATAFAILLAQVITGRTAVLAGPSWPQALQGDGSELVVGATAELLPGWDAVASTGVRLAGVLVTGEPPLAQPWGRLARRAGGCPVSYLGGPAIASGVAFSGDVTAAGACGARMLGRAVAGSGVIIDDGCGGPMPASLPGILTVRPHGGGRPVPICRARVTGTGLIEMVSPLLSPMEPVSPPICQLEAALGALPGVGDAAASWQRRPGRRCLTVSVVPQPGTRLRSAEVMAELRRRLAPHLLPEELHVVQRLAASRDGWLERGPDHGTAGALGPRLVDALTE